MNKCIFVYGFNNFQLEQVRKAFVMRNYDVRNVLQEQYGWLIGELTGEYKAAEEHDMNLQIPGKMVLVA